MSNIGFIRMQKECKEIITSDEVIFIKLFFINKIKLFQLKENGITIEPLNESLNVLAGTIRGPPDSSYENGTFALDIKIPNEYPFKPPKVFFKIYF